MRQRGRANSENQIVAKRKSFWAFALFASGYLLFPYSAGVSVAQAAVTLPIEVMGPDGTYQSVTVNVPSAAGINSLWMQVNNLSYPNPVVPYAKASVQINGGPWIDLTNQTVQVDDPGKSYGGIGGAFSTLKITLPLSAGTVQSGDNIINFRFNATDGVSSGYRVLKFNFLAGGSKVLPESTFAYDQPSLWTAPPEGNPAHGQTLWTSASLVSSPGNQYVKQHPIGAHCMDCHTQDGRDLKYFNFSNNSIVTRAQFHGLSAQDALDLAAYIRTLPVDASVSGRPWNPVYQPGPGLDSQPVYEWAAGAGIDNVLDNDIDTLKDIFPGGINAGTADPSSDINVRETRISLQLMDWNHWLPHTFPGDAQAGGIGAGNFSQTLTNYANVRNDLVNGKLYDFLVNNESKFEYGLENTWLLPLILPTSTPWDPDYSQKVYDVGLWDMVKHWEFFNEFALQIPAVVNPHEYAPLPSRLLEPRGWPTNDVFNASPNILHIPPYNGVGITGSGVVSQYFSSAWYQLQLILNSNRWDGGGQRPQDWPYVWGKLKDLCLGDPNNAQHPSPGSNYPEGARWALFMMKAGQITDNGKGPDDIDEGWRPGHSYMVAQMAEPGFSRIVSDIAASGQWGALAQAMIQGWYNKTASYPYEQYTYTSNSEAGIQVADRNEVPTQNFDASPWHDLEDKTWAMIPAYRGIGVSETLLDQIITWSQGMWPNGAWDLLRTGTVAPYIIINNGIPLNPKDSNGNPTIPLPAGVNIPIDISAAYFATAPPVELYVNGVKVATGQIGSSQHTTLNWTPLAVGTYTLEARANINGKFVRNQDDSPVHVLISGAATGVGISVSPNPPAAVNPGQTLQFTATVTGSANTAVVWTYNMTVGTLSSNGLFTAPAYVMANHSVTVVATSVADPSQQSSTTFTLNAGGSAGSAPAAPTGLTATAGDNQISLSWTASPDPSVVSYNVYRSTNGQNGPYAIVNPGPVTLGPSYVDMVPVDGLANWYEVTAINTNNLESAMSAPASATPIVPPQAAAPLISPNGGTNLTNPVTVTIACATPGATIYYTLDGTAPNIGSFIYLNPLTLPGTIMVQAQAMAASLGPSAISSATFVFAGGSYGGVLPVPDLSGISAYEPLNATISLTYPIPGVSFVWSLSNGTGSSYGSLGRSQAFGSLSSPVVQKTLTPSMSFGQFGSNLTPGVYTLTVYATDGSNNSATASRSLTLIFSDFSSARIYPNPWRSDKHSGLPVIFDQLPTGSTVKIFTLSGHLARTLDAPAGTTSWDLTNDSGDKVASGIYIYLITTGNTGYGGNGQKVRGKVAVIR